MAFRKILMGVVALAAAASAQAGTISLSTTLSLSDHLRLGQNKSVQLDMNGAMSKQGLGGAKIQSGTLTILGNSQALYGFAGMSATEYAQVGSSKRNARICLPFLGCSNRTVTDTYNLSDVTVNYLDGVADTMRVRVGNTVASDSADWHSSYGAFGASQQDFVWGTNGTGYDYYSHRSRDYTGGYSGLLSITIGLDAAALADLGSDGVLGLNIWSSLGQFDLSSVRLDVTAAVPLPGSLLLMGLGLAALGAARRRQQAK